MRLINIHRQQIKVGGKKLFMKQGYCLLFTKRILFGEDRIGWQGYNRLGMNLQISGFISQTKESKASASKRCGGLRTVTASVIHTSRCNTVQTPRP